VRARAASHMSRWQSRQKKVLCDHTLGAYDVCQGPSNVVPSLASGAQFPVIDPLYRVPARAALSRYNVTIFHATRPSLTWSTVESRRASACGFSYAHDERYARADEYLEVLYKLWEGSFRDNAVLADRQLGTYSFPPN
jgi:hypothetical protein